MPQLLYPRFPILNLPVELQWLSGVLLNFAFSFVVVSPQGLEPQPWAHMPHARMLSFFKSQRKALFFPECKLISMRMQKSVLKLFVLQ